MSDPANILIVEDEEEIREILKTFVGKMGYNPIVAHDGLMGIELAMANQIDVVISDLMMPNVSGMMLLSELRRVGYTKPFIFVTAYPSQEASVQALRLGAFDFLEKPFEGSEVRQIVREAVKASMSDRGRSEHFNEDQKTQFAASQAKQQVAKKQNNVDETKHRLEVFLKEVSDQLPICEKSLKGLLTPKIQRWEVGYLMRTMQAFRASSLALELNSISELANNLESMAMQARINPDLLNRKLVEEFQEGLDELKKNIDKLRPLK